MTSRLAILVPVRNGGELLVRSVTSIGDAELDGSRAEVLVLDNMSTDGQADRLPALLPNGIPVQVIHNEADLGRVGNWNRCVETARAQGFTHASFLFAGDTWLPGPAARTLLDRMEETSACLGLAPYQMVREDGSLLRHSPRISTGPDGETISVGDLFERMMGRGHIPITPLQANIYCLQDRERTLLFDPDTPLTTDMYATIDFLCAVPGDVVIGTSPFAAWLAREGRVFCSSGLEAFLIDHFRQLEYAAKQSGVALNYGHAKSVFLSSYVYSALQFEGWRAMPAMLRKTLQEAGRFPGAVSPADIVRLAIDKYCFGRSVLHLS